MDKQLALGAATYQKWAEFIKVCKDKAHLSRLEIENMVDAHQMLSVERVMTILTCMADEIKKNVSNTTERANLINAVAKLLGTRPAS